MANRRCHGGGGWRRLRTLRWRKQTTAGWQSLGSMKRSCSSPARRWRRVWQSACTARAQLCAYDGGKRARPGLRRPGTRDRPHARGMGQVDVTGHRGKMRQDGAARAKRERTAVCRRQRPFLVQPWQLMHACSGPSLSMIPSCGAYTIAALLTREESARTDNAARAWQWRRVALHEGYEALSRGAVVTPLFAALNSSQLSTHEQAYLRSVVVDRQWTQQRKYRVAKTLSPLCALCGSEEGSLIQGHFRCSEVQYGEPSNMRGFFFFQAAAVSGALWTHQSFAARALLPAFRGRRRPQSVHWGHLR